MLCEVIKFEPVNKSYITLLCGLIMSFCIGNTAAAKSKSATCVWSRVVRALLHFFDILFLVLTCVCCGLVNCT